MNIKRILFIALVVSAIVFVIHKRCPKCQERLAGIKEKFGLKPEFDNTISTTN